MNGLDKMKGMNAPASISALHHACCINDFEHVKTLIEDGVSVNATCGAREMTALHYAAVNGNNMCIAELLKSPDIDVHLGDIDGVNAIWWADMFYHSESVSMLLEAGAVFEW